MEPVKPRELLAAARVADALVYAAGLAGVIAGALLLRAGQEGFAVVAWVLTFIAGAALRLASWASKALAEMLIRTERIENDLAALVRSDGRPMPPPERERDAPADPYRRWGGWH
ncbi:hypothetical protein BH23ACT7_BH23ACT7_18540 [soil metagenome]|jgi:hypothetical protein|nr:hypothetical protein [Euzebyaceae bacterium]